MPRTPAAVLLALALAPAAAAADPAAVRGVLARHCLRCHGSDGAAEGGLADVADLPKLAGRGVVKPGDAAGSKLVKRLRDGSMPPAGEGPRPTDAEVAAVAAWVADGAVADAGPAPAAAGDVAAAMLADLSRLDRRARRFQRYFLLSPGEAGAREKLALAKLVNALSWNSTPRPPEPVSATVVRVDLRWYNWDATLWNRVLADYPFGVVPDLLDWRVAVAFTGTRVPAVRADWFVATASRPPLYYDLLQLPQSIAELERQLRVDAAADLAQDRVVRAGFNGSGVSRNNRLIERHDAATGVYWRTFDFEEAAVNLTERAGGATVPDRRNLFAFPLGPGLVDAPFQPAGGEAIFALPNGLHGYFLARADGTRLDKAPTAIVADPKRPDKAVEAGISCMSCHSTGILPKADQLRDHVSAHPDRFTRADAERVRGLHPPAADALKLMAQDAARFTQALAKAGVPAGVPDPVNPVAHAYEADLDLPAAARELGLTPAELRSRAAAAPELRATVAPLLSGGALPRAVWVQSFADAAAALGLGAVVPPNQLGALSADNTADPDPLAGDDALAAALSADGRRALVAGADRGVRVRDTESGRDIARLVGHAQSVWSVALSADERTAASGGADGTVRVWDLARRSETRALDAHAGPVAAVALTPDGKTLVTAGLDNTAAGFDPATGAERFRIALPGPAHAAAAHPRRRVVAVSAGREVLILDAATGRTVTRWANLPAPAGALAFDAAGDALAAGFDDGTVTVWPAAGGPPRVKFAAHAGPVRAVALDGPRVLTGADRTARAWDAAGKPERQSDKHAAAVVAVRPAGRQLASVDRTSAARFTPLGAAPQPTGPPDRIPPAAP